MCKVKRGTTFSDSVLNSEECRAKLNKRQIVKTYWFPCLLCFHLILRKRETLVESFCIYISTSDEKMVEKLRPDELASFREAFDTFDKNSDGTISTKVTLHWGCLILFIFWTFQELHAAMRRAGQNPTESEVQDMINSVRYFWCNHQSEFIIGNWL